MYSGHFEKFKRNGLQDKFYVAAFILSVFGFTKEIDKKTKRRVEREYQIWKSSFINNFQQQRKITEQLKRFDVDRNHPILSCYPVLIEKMSKRKSPFTSQENITDNQVVWDYVTYNLRKFTIYFKNHVKGLPKKCACYEQV